MCSQLGLRNLIVANFSQFPLNLCESLTDFHNQIFVFNLLPLPDNIPVDLNLFFSTNVETIIFEYMAINSDFSMVIFVDGLHPFSTIKNLFFTHWGITITGGSNSYKHLLAPSSHKFSLFLPSFFTKLDTCQLVRDSFLHSVKNKGR